MKKEFKEKIKIEIFKLQPRIRNERIKNLKKYLKKNSEFRLLFNPRLERLEDYKGFKVFIVNGELIRNKLDIDFVMGGNGCRYLYIPIDEIWIEKSYAKNEELKEILLHEYTELELMKKGYTYEKAHDNASVKELIERRNGKN
jgi:hypothetical protein